MIKSCYLLIVTSLLLLTCKCAFAQKAVISGPVGSSPIGFGNNIAVLASGNYVIADPYYNLGTKYLVGAVFLYDGRTNALISTLHGTYPNDQVGSNVTVLSNGNFVVSSPGWDSGRGAVTWVDGLTGLNDSVTSSNSLIGSSRVDKVGGDGILALSNGNYVVLSSSWQGRGAATWANGATGIRGTISDTNSLVGNNGSDNVGTSAVELTNGNYVVTSPHWNNGFLSAVGALTWANGMSGIRGVVSSTNSFTGSQALDEVGWGGVVPLSNGNYVVSSPYWDNGTMQDAGAATWLNGSAAATGVVTASNSIIGDSTWDRVSSAGVKALANGNYVVLSPYWWNGRTYAAGAATWGNGSTGTAVIVSPANSLVGSTPSDGAGSGATALTNGNYIVLSPNWDNGLLTADAGAATWCNGSTGRVGTVSVANSLIGGWNSNNVGTYATALTNGNYVVGSPGWDNVGIYNVGAATWGNGTTGITGVVDSNNSLIGWYQGGVAATVVSLFNGNYVVTSPQWAMDLGAVTWGSGSTGVTGVVGTHNSMIGKPGDRLGSACLALASGNYVVTSPGWDNGPSQNVGAARCINGAIATTDTISTANSLIGTASTGIDGNLIALDSNKYIISNSVANNGSLTEAGAVTLAWAIPGSNGFVDTCNSVFGSAVNSGWGLIATCNKVYVKVLAGFPVDTKVYVINDLTEPISLTRDSSTKNLNGWNTVSFVSPSSKLVCSIRPSGASPVSGTVASKVYVQNTAPSYNGHAYLRRYYEIAPAANANAATATVTLYYTQGDFDDYNANNGPDPDLPTGPGDATGISHIKITQQHGTSSTGLPGNFNGWNGIGSAYIAIDPSDADIIWNDCASRWEVTFDVAGFSGFFSYGSTDLSPLSVASETRKQSSLLITPVPATSILTIRNGDESLDGQPATIVDVQGSVIYSFTLRPDQEIDVRNWSAGVYHLKLAKGQVVKLVKE